MSELQCGRFRVDLSRPRVMGILNVTPDSFSDGGRHDRIDAALRHAAAMIDAGADMIDIGGESTRPGAPPVDAGEERRRVVPVVAALRDCGVPLSVDTFKPEVMAAALDAGADMINDIRGFQMPGAIDTVRAGQCGLSIMHMQRDPQTMQQAPAYDDVVAEVRAFLRERATALAAVGIARARLVVDPGFGFGKTVEHNFRLLARLGELAGDGLPVLAGLSRKSSLGAVTGRPVGERLAASVAAALLAVERGAAIVRVHDVAPTVDALKVLAATRVS